MLMSEEIFIVFDFIIFQMIILYFITSIVVSHIMASFAQNCIDKIFGEIKCNTDLAGFNLLTAFFLGLLSQRLSNKIPCKFTPIYRRVASPGLPQLCSMHYCKN